MEQKLKFIQNQKQKFSNKLVPSMEILQISQQDLENLVEASLIDNPFSDLDQEEISFETSGIDLDYKTVYKKQDDLQNFELADENDNDLIEYVFPQLTSYFHNSKEEHIFKTLLESLDSRGFLAAKKDDLCLYLEIDQKQLDHYLKILGHMDPKGLGTSGVQECIIRQLEEYEDSELAIKLIQKYLVEIGNTDFNKIAKEEKVSLSKVKKSLDMIQSCNPLPANGFKVDTKPVYIIPDVNISMERNEVKISMNNNIEKRLKLNSENYHLYKSNQIGQESKEFLKEKLKEFRLLQYSVSRRMITVNKIITYLVEYQIDFFKSGDANRLKPLRLSDVADALDIHKSTVSRAISNKYFQCEYGVFTFRYLIPRTYVKKGKQALPSKIIKNEIKEIIRLEDKNSPYTDQQIYELLAEEGYDVSRRSVSLYRKECQIPSSKNRKIFQKKG